MKTCAAINWKSYMVYGGERCKSIENLSIRRRDKKNYIKNCHNLGSHAYTMSIRSTVSTWLLEATMT